MGLTYRSAGVDIEAAGKAKERIRALVCRTHSERVLTRAGLFGGAVSIRDALSHEAPVLSGALGFAPEAVDGPAVVERCLAKLPAGAQPVAFLDYIAAARLKGSSVERWVGGLADRLSRNPPIPLIGGETAEMPGVFQPGAWEAVGAMFAMGGGCGADISRIRRFSHPALVFSMDGVGTKTKLGVLARRTGGLALDIIHHSLNDILCLGAEGLGLLIYIGCHDRDDALLEPIVRKSHEACARLGLSVFELAVQERPQAYLAGEVDLCAAIAGMVDADRLVQGQAIRAGDSLIGLAADGLHTNGYSLARRALLERGGLRLDRHLEELGRTLEEALLAAHRNYAPAVLGLLRGEPPAVRGIAHVTGGGLADNLARILPEGLGAEIRLAAWEVPPLFRLIQRLGEIPEHDPVGKGMFETFNMGIGLVLAVEAGREEETFEHLKTAGETPFRIGTILPLEPDRSCARVRFVL